MFYVVQKDSMFSYPDSHLILCCVYQSRKLCFGGFGNSRCRYQGFSFLLLKRKGNIRINHLAIWPLKRYNAGLANTNAIPFIPIFFSVDTYPSAVISCLHFQSCSCISIFTGQTLLQEPHKLEANGKSAFAFISMLGLRIDPIGPATAV